MAIRPKTPEAIERMRAAGRTVAQVLERLGRMVRPGVTTGDLDAEAARLFRECGARSLFVGQPHPRGGPPYPASICVSVNEELVHGIPGPRVIREGDLVSVDVGVQQDGWCADAARTVAVGRVPERWARLVAATEEALEIVRREARAGVFWSAVAGQIERSVERAGFSIVTDYVGHGIGRQMWEEPKVPNYVSPDLLRSDWVMLEDMTLAVEPMVNLGSPRVREQKDGWTVVTADGKPCAHVEDTFVVHRDGAEPLTRLDAAAEPERA
jgi:methionyl aminopeptidase